MPREAGVLDQSLPRWHFSTFFPAITNQMETSAMKRTRGLWVGAISALFVASAAQAQTTIDVSKISCDQLVTARVASPDYIAIWLSGFYNGKRNNTIIDVQRLQDNAQKIRTYCLYNNKGTVMEAVEKVLSQEK
jgi:acid stress chaperone HdeB